MIKNKFINGFLMGIILPGIAFAILYYFDDALTYSKTVNITGNDHFMWAGFKKSTLFLMAICANLIPTFFANRKLMEEFIRGIMIPTVVYSFIWFYYYRSSFM